MVFSRSHVDEIQAIKRKPSYQRNDAESYTRALQISLTVRSHQFIPKKLCPEYSLKELKAKELYFKPIRCKKNTILKDPDAKIMGDISDDRGRDVYCTTPTDIFYVLRRVMMRGLRFSQSMQLQSDLTLSESN